MRKLLLGLVVGAFLLGSASGVRADAYDDSQSHPLRLAGFLVHPIGVLLEWGVTRPIHMLVSIPVLEPVFGHTPHDDPFGQYDPYEPGY